MYSVDPDICTGCQRCIDQCPQGAIAMVAGKARIDQEKCTACGKCARICPADAITAVVEPVSIQYPAQMRPDPPLGMPTGGGWNRGRGFGRGVRRNRPGRRRGARRGCRTGRI